MAEHDGLDGDDTGFVPLLAGFPQLCAGAMAGLGSALWLNVVGPFAGPVAAWGALALVNALAVAVVAVLAMLVTTAGTLLAADWRADVVSRRACAEIDVAAAEFLLPAGRVVPPQIDPRYLAATNGGTLPGVFGAHRFASLVSALQACTHRPAAICRARTDVASGGSIPPVAAPVAHRIARKISASSASDVALARSSNLEAAGVAQPLIVASCRALKQVSHAKRDVSAARLVANGAWSERLPHHHCVLTRAPPDRHVADIVVLSGDRGDRGQPDLPGPSTGDGTVKSDEPPSCRGPPEGSWKVRARAAPRPADPIVCDDLSRQVPIRAAELDVIETYLDQVLRDVLATTNSGQDSQAP
jgi:hypothetical protein